MKNKLNCILLFDDDDATNFLNDIIIREADCAAHINTRNNPGAALEYIAESAVLSEKPNPLPFPDLIFPDIIMQEMDGWAFLKKYKELERKFPQTPVIILHTVTVKPTYTFKARRIPEVAEINKKPMAPEMVKSIFAKYFPDYL